ncbi:HD domain-containing phosphohydrolase [Marinobacter sp. X15-166B]|uniref:HD domain-containing phosphohydrolase n=1 Tax=Marinobacter sp. X15-166B TaxID=1897620 RepID=UPI00085BE3FE|nr:HD domain-containing phosphohydrolase [Marinobacter sp. X15-166B]OEY66573.1 two-component system response regulator [Marinobacter sp. X15-166B]
MDINYSDVDTLPSQPPAKARLLLVDDEENILRSLHRVMRREPYELAFARSGEEALQRLATETFDLVISDAHMPGISGPDLLARIKQKYPGCIRILLTGYTDLASTIAAINEGQIYRYISKPWEEDELRLTVRQALAFQYSERRRLALEQLTRAQNQELQVLNATLEDKVRARTEELEQTAGMLDLAYQELRQSYTTAAEVFSALINKRLPAKRQPNAKVIALVKAFAEHCQLDSALTWDVTMAAALYNLGKLSWPDQMIETPSELMGKVQREEYQRYPVTGEKLLMALEPLRNAACIIRHHQERWSGKGVPDQLAGEQIPLGARVLKLAVDFVEFQFGLILERKVSREDAITLVGRYKGLVYDPEMADQFLQMIVQQAPDVEGYDPAILRLDTLRVTPGMVLARNLYAASGMLLLNEGKVLTASLIEKLTAFEQNEPNGLRYELYVYPPENEEKETAS